MIFSTSVALVTSHAGSTLTFAFGVALQTPRPWTHNTVVTWLFRSKKRSNDVQHLKRMCLWLYASVFNFTLLDQSKHTYIIPLKALPQWENLCLVTTISMGMNGVHLEPITTSRIPQLLNGLKISRYQLTNFSIIVALFVITYRYFIKITRLLRTI